MAARKHDFTVTEIKAGFMVIGTVVVGVILLLAALNRPDLLEGVWAAIFGSEPTVEYAVKFEEASGLNPNADVRFGGARAGKVKAVELDKEARLIVAVLDVPASIPINTGSRAYIGQATLTAEPHVEVTVGSPQAPLLTDPSAGRVEMFDGKPVIATEPGGLFGSISKLAGDLRELIGVEEARSKDIDFTTVADVVTSVNDTLLDGQDLLHQTSDIFDERNDDLGRILAEDIDPILADTQAMMESAREFAVTMSDSADKVNVWIDDNDDRLTETVQSARQVASDIENLTAELENYKAKVTNILDNSEDISDEAKQILQRNAPVVEDMLADLREAMRFFVSFAEVLAENPQALIRGQREGGREPDESGTLGREPDR